jgi:two-component system, LytTR family, response regulator
MKIRVLIADDEPLARERLADLVVAEPDLELLAQCANGNDALAAIRAQKPDLVFLDVQMPERDGFGVLAGLEPGKMPAVVFVTAYDQFAIKAFDVHAVDYLLKPFDSERFQKALRRAREQLQRGQSGDINTQLSALLASLKAPAPALDRIAVKTGGAVIFVKLEEIDWIEAADNYVEIHVGSVTHLHRETLTTLTEKLPGNFLRISRSGIVNADRIKELQPLSHGDYAVLLANGTRVTLSRGYRECVKERLGLA